MKTFARYEQTEVPYIFPESWSRPLEELLAQVYSKQCKQAGRGFKTYAASFPGELLVIVSWMSLERIESAPITLLLSMDLTEQTAQEEKLKRLVDCVGLFFDELIESDLMEEELFYEPMWVEKVERDLTFFYKISRENIALTLEANKLLGEQF